MSGQRVVVVGGGVIGAMTAWYLAERGCRVTILERDRFAGGCSHANCGYVCPSHVLPLAQPRAVANTMKKMWRRNAPLRISPWPSISLFSWLWQFARRCNHEAMLQAATARYELLRSSMALYDDLIHSEQIDCGWERQGLLIVFDTVAERDAFRSTQEMIETHCGIQARCFDADEIVQHEPALREGLGGAWFYPGDAHLRPEHLMAQIRMRLEERGVSIAEGNTLEAFVRRGDTASAVMANSESFEADAFVIATGALTPLLRQQLGCRVPIQPGKGYSLTMQIDRDANSAAPRLPVIFESTHVATTPFESSLRIGSTMEFVGYDSSLNRSRIRHLHETAKRYYRDSLSAPIEQEWFGWRPMTWDGLPAIDRLPRFNNVWLAAGHNMVGLSMATATGKLISELMTDQRPHIDPQPYRLSRFK